MNKQFIPNPKIKPVTMAFQPNLAYKLIATPSVKRAWAQWVRIRNYRERIGYPIKYVCNPLLQAEMDALRRRIYELETESIQSAIKAAVITLGTLKRGGQKWTEETS